MTTEAMQDLASRYDARFGNLDDLCAPEILFDPRFARLLETALQTGRALTSEQIDVVIPGVAWKY